MRQALSPLGQLISAWRWLARAFAIVFGRRSKARLAVFFSLFAAGVGFVVLSQGHGIQEHEHVFAQVLQALGESLLIASLLATVADPFVQQRFAEEWGLGVFWAIFNVDAPPALRQAVNSVAQPERYIAHAEWLLELTWENEERTTVLLELVSHRRVVCVKREGWHPITAESGIVTDCEGNPSRFTELSINARDWSFALDESNIAKYTSVDESGTTHLRPADALKGKHVGYRDEVLITTSMRTKMRSVDSIPLFSRATCLQWSVGVRGPAVPDLFIELFGSGAPAGEPEPSEQSDRWTYRSKKDTVTFPGHGLVLQWRPKSGSLTKTGAAVAGL